MGLSIPEDGNYSSWLPYLTDKVNKYCDDMTLNVPDGNLGSALFESVSDPSQADKLQQWMTSDISMGDYVLVKVGPLITLVLAIVILTTCTILSFAIIPSFRKWIAKVFHICKDRPRTRFEDVNPTWKMLSWMGTFFVVAGLLATTITMWVDSAQILQADNAAFCDTWMQMRGHFFGVDGYHKGNVDNVAWDWKGTMAQLDELTNISAKVLPGDDNPLKAIIEDGYYNLQISLNASVNSTKDFATQNMNTLAGFQDVVNAANGMLSKIPKYSQKSDVKLWLGDVTVSKTVEYNEVLDECLVDGYNNITEAIDKYVGPNSELLSAGYGLATDAIQSLKDTNEYIGHLLLRWDELAGLLDGLLKFVIAMSFMIPIFSFILACVSGYIIIFKLVRGAYKNDELPSQNCRKALAVCYVGFLTIAGSSALFAAVQYLLGGIGYDACYMAEVDLFEKGNWNILGQKILHSVENSSVDIWQILDICLKNDGDGDVANGLGIQGLLTSLETSTTMAETDINGMVQRVLNPADKIIRAELMRVGFHDALMFIYRSEEINKDDQEGYFNDTHYVRSDYLEDDWTSWPLLCLAPALGEPAATVMDWCLQDMLFPVAPMNRALDRINNDVVPVVRAVDATFPLFCSTYNQEKGYQCDSQAVMIDKDFKHGDLSGYIDRVSAVDPVLGSKFKFAADGIATHEEMNAMIYSDILAKIEDDNSFAPNLNCTDDGVNPSCTYHDLREHNLEWFETNAPRFVNDAKTLLSKVNDFVADPVISTMDSLIGDAKSSLTHFNCQFVGTTLHAAAVAALCDSLFPGVTLLALLFAFHCLFCALAAWGNWRHYHYIVDLAAEWAHTSENDYYAKSKTQEQAQQCLLADENVREAYMGTPDGSGTPPTSVSSFSSENKPLIEDSSLQIASVEPVS